MWFYSLSLCLWHLPPIWALVRLPDTPLTFQLPDDGLGKKQKMAQMLDTQRSTWLQIGQLLANVAKYD